jgi:hypothetical protein
MVMKRVWRQPYLAGRAPEIVLNHGVRFRPADGLCGSCRGLGELGPLEGWRGLGS